MKLRAIGRFLLVRTDYDLINDISKRQIIQLPREVTERLKGGVQVHTVLSMGESAFDDEPPDTRESIKVGTQVVTSRYPGHELDFDPLAHDRDVISHRLISSDEVHAVIDEEEGVDVRGN